MSKISPRKEPQQERSKQTVDSLLEAAEQLLIEEGFHKASTNRIAERAGVSVGSLYQYFPNKEALVAAVVENFGDRQFEVLAAQLEQVGEAPLEEAVRMLITAMLEAKLLEPELSRVLFEQLPPIGQVDVLQHWTERACTVVEAALTMRADEIRTENVELAAFVLVNACHGVVHSAVLQRPDLIDNGDLAEETVQLVVGYLRPRATS
jgi:AcrR family transcriptional regulator